MPLDPHHLRAFLAVRKHRSYTRAAEELVLSQSAISRQVGLLERRLGIPLFEQIGKAVHLTDAGRTLAPEAERILGDLDRVAEAVRAHGDPDRGRLRIGASTTPGFYLLPRPVGLFHARNPAVEIAYTIQNSLEIERMLLRNEVDVGFVGAHLASTELRKETVLEDEIVCFSGASHPLARRRPIDPRLLEKELWIVREPGSATRRLFESWLAEAGAGFGPKIELRCPEAIKSLVAAGVGIGSMSIHGIEGADGRGRFRVLPVRGLRLRRPIYLVRHADKRDSSAMSAFLDVVRSTLRQPRSGASPPPGARTLEGERRSAQRR